jgi:hypothetical protein
LKKIIQAGNTLRVVTFLKTLATIFASWNSSKAMLPR